MALDPAPAYGQVNSLEQDEYFPEFFRIFSRGGLHPEVKWEAHRVTTQDGYIKTLFRLLPS